jgi:hypothetical protein
VPSHRRHRHIDPVAEIGTLEWLCGKGTFVARPAGYRNALAGHMSSTGSTC